MFKAKTNEDIENAKRTVINYYYQASRRREEELKKLQRDHKKTMQLAAEKIEAKEKELAKLKKEDQIKERLRSIDSEERAFRSILEVTEEFNTRNLLIVMNEYKDNINYISFMENLHKKICEESINELIEKESRARELITQEKINKDIELKIKPMEKHRRLNYLENKIQAIKKEKIKETNRIFENHYPHKASNLYKINNEHSHHVATYHDLIQQSYLAQLNFQKMFQNGTSEYEIEKYKKHMLTANKRAKKYFEENAKNFIQYVEIKFKPQYCNNVYFSSDFLKEQIKFMQNSENHMDLILQNNTPFFLKRCINYLEEQDNHTNKPIQKILKEQSKIINIINK